MSEPMTWTCPDCGVTRLGEGHAPTCMMKGYPFDQLAKSKILYDNWEQIGNCDLRYDDHEQGGFYHVALREGNTTIVINEDDLVELRDRLTKTIAKTNS